VKSTHTIIYLTFIYFALARRPVGTPVGLGVVLGLLGVTAAAAKLLICAVEPTLGPVDVANIEAACEAFTIFLASPTARSPRFCGVSRCSGLVEPPASSSWVLVRIK
jgi:hypothetical protein